MTSIQLSLVLARRIASLGVVLLFGVMVAAPVMAQRDPLVGTWTLNPAKSTYSPGPAPRSEVVTYEAAEDGVKYTVKQTGADGKSAVLEGRLIYDGKDYPATGTSDYDAVSTRRIDANTSETARTKGGKVVQTVRRVLSTDGRTLTLTTKGVMATGASIHNVAVYDRS